MDEKKASRITLIVLLAAQLVTAFALPYILPLGRSLTDVGVRLGVMAGALLFAYGVSRLLIAFLRSRDIPRH